MAKRASILGPSPHDAAVQVPDGLIAEPQSVEPETAYPSMEDRLRGFF